jgi:FkbM family methyltransferase
LEKFVQQPLRLVTYAWGKHHVDDLLNFALASALAPGNLPALVKVFDCTVVIVTEESLFDHVKSSSAARALQGVCPLKLVALDDLISEPWQYGMTLTHSLFRGFEDLGPAMTETYILFLNADFILADGCYERLIPRILSEERAHLSPSYCTVSERVEPSLYKKTRNGVLSIPPRELAALILNNRHNTIRAKTVNEQLAFEYADQFYWIADQTTLLGRQMPISLIGMRPERRVSTLNTFWDWGLVYEFCPSKKLTVLGDSDEFLMMELRPEKRSLELLQLGRRPPTEIAKRMAKYITKYQIDNAQFSLVLHSGELPPSLLSAQRNLQQHVNSVVKNLPSTDHHRHKQWLYHRRHFRERLARRSIVEYRSGRKGSSPTARFKSTPIASLKPKPTKKEMLIARLLEVAHPYKSQSNALQKVRRRHSDKNSSFLLICNHDSYLLRTLEEWPGLHTHLTPESVAEGALDLWGNSFRKFDVCLIEVSKYEADLILNAFDAAVPSFREGTEVLFLWHDRLVSDLRYAETIIAGFLALRETAFDLHYTVSRASAIATQWLPFARAQNFRSMLGGPRAIFGVVFGGSAAVIARLLEAFKQDKSPKYLSQDTSSITVSTTLSAESLLKAQLKASQHRATKASRFSREYKEIELYFNTSPEFTKWIVKYGALKEAFVVVDVGVLGGESSRWHFLGDHLVVHGFDAAEEAIAELRARSPGKNRFYYPTAIGNEDGERIFFFDHLHPTDSSFYGTSEGWRDSRLVEIRTLDSLLMKGAIPQADFLKVDVEGFERDVFLGAQNLLSGGVLGVEVETNFETSIDYRKGHFSAIYDLLLGPGLKLFDLNFDRKLQPTYAQMQRPTDSVAGAGIPSTFNMLFARDLIAEHDGKQYYERPPIEPSVDQILKTMVICELYGLSDVAVEIAQVFSERLQPRIDVEQAIELLNM